MFKNNGCLKPGQKKFENLEPVLSSDNTDIEKNFSCKTSANGFSIFYSRKF